MRASRIGIRSGSRPWLDSSSRSSGVRRPGGSQTAWLESGTARRRARPASASAPAIRTFPNVTVRLSDSIRHAGPGWTGRFRNLPRFPSLAP